MTVLAIDVSTSAVKAAIVRRRKLVGQPVRTAFATHYHDDRAEVSADAVLHAVANAIKQLGPIVKKVDSIAMTAMGPSWVAMNRDGKAVTPVVTHQDRRSVGESKWLVDRVGKSRILKLSGNLPFPGGISSTTWLWFNRNAPAVMKRADMVGNLQTYLHHHLNHSRVIDPSHASFTGLYDTIKQRGWNEELCDLVGATEHQLPQLVESEGVAGMVTRSAGQAFGLTHGTPMLVGCLDTTAAMLLSKCERGQLLNVSGSTDVLALCTDKPRPHEQLLTRALGVGHDRWLSVSTLAAAGSSLSWAKDQLYADISIERFFKLVGEIATDSASEAGHVAFEPYLAGDRASIEQRRAAFAGLSLSTPRRQMLAAIVESLAKASAARLDLFAKTGLKINRNVITAGGSRGALEKLLHRDWPGKWKFKYEDEATLRGLSVLAEG